MVLSRTEAADVLARLGGITWYRAALMYGGGLRLLESCRLRVKDIDFDRHEIAIRNGKGDKDRVTMLPQTLINPIQKLLVRVRALHEKDVRNGAGYVELPYALRRKYPSAAASWDGNGSFPPRECTPTAKPTNVAATSCIKR